MTSEALAVDDRPVSSVPARPSFAALCAAQAPVRAAGRSAVFHRPSYLGFDGLPLSADTDFKDPASLPIPEPIAKHFALYFHLALIASQGPFGPDVAPVSIPELLRFSHRGRRRTYESLKALAKAGYVFSVPAPKHVAIPGCSRVFCLRVPASPESTAQPKREFQHDGAPWLGKRGGDDSATVVPMSARRPAPADAAATAPLSAAGAEADGTADAADPSVEQSSTFPRRPPPTPSAVLDAISAPDRFELTKVALRAIDAKFGPLDPRDRAKVEVIARGHFFVHPLLGVPRGIHTLERAVDILPRARYRNEIADLFRERHGKDEPNNYAHLKAPPVLPSTASRDTPFSAYSYERFGDGPQVLLDGDTHPAFPGFIAQGGCLHTPRYLCKCPNRKQRLRRHRGVDIAMPDKPKRPLWAYLVRPPADEPPNWTY